MNSEVNIKYVLGLEEQADKTLQIVKIDIPQSSDIIEELEAMQENPNKNLYDMSSYFYHYVNPIEDCYNYCLPEEYYKSYLNEQVSSAPKEIPYWEYRKIETDGRTTWERRLYKKEELSQQELEQQWKEYVHKVEYSIPERLSECFDKTLSNIIPKHTFTKEDDDVWAKSGYDPTPTIIEAAVALYEHHTVEEITKHDGEIEVTAKCLDKIINECQSNKRKAICFITGVPGAGKTLIGLQTAIKQFEKENKAVYLSGNYPLANASCNTLTSG